MVVKIRLARFGNARNPVYNIVVAQARSARGSKPMEVLGTYDPRPRTPLASASAVMSNEHEIVSNTNTSTTSAIAPEATRSRTKRYKDIQLDTSRTKYWLGVGAQPSEPMERLLCMKMGRNADLEILHLLDRFT